MYHTIEFGCDFTIDLEVAPKQHRERLRIRTGVRLKAQVRPYVIEAPDGPVEVADLFFDDGTAARTVPYELFAFVE